VIAPVDHDQVGRRRQARQHRAQFVGRAEGVTFALHEQHR